MSPADPELHQQVGVRHGAAMEAGLMSPADYISSLIFVLRNSSPQWRPG